MADPNRRPPSFMAPSYNASRPPVNTGMPLGAMRKPNYGPFVQPTA